MPSPFDLADLPFLREALVEVILLGAAGGLLSAWIVLRRLAFFTHAVGSATFPGLVAADAWGISPLLAGVAVALRDAGGVERAGRAGREPSEATALLLVAALATGVVLASDVFESGAAVDRLLFGSLLGLGTADLAAWAATAARQVALATVTLGGRGGHGEVGGPEPEQGSEQQPVDPRARLEHVAGQQTPVASAATSNSAVASLGSRPARPARSTPPAYPSATASPASRRADPPSIRDDQAGKVAEPTACEKKASRRNTIHALSRPPAAASRMTSASASRRNGRSARSRGEGIPSGG